MVLIKAQGRRFRPSGFPGLYQYVVVLAVRLPKTSQQILRRYEEIRYLYEGIAHRCCSVDDHRCKDGMNMSAKGSDAHTVSRFPDWICILVVSGRVHRGHLDSFGVRILQAPFCFCGFPLPMSRLVPSNPDTVATRSAHRPSDCCFLSGSSWNPMTGPHKELRTELSRYDVLGHPKQHKNMRNTRKIANMFELMISHSRVDLLHHSYS